MAKAGRKSTSSIDRALAAAQQAELSEELRRLAQSPQAHALREQLATARAQAELNREASKRLTRAIAIRDGLIAPPWASKLLAQQQPKTPKTHSAPQVDRILRAIPEVFPNGIDGIANPVVRQKVAKYLESEIKKGLAVPSPDTFDRALRKNRRTR